MMFFTLFSGIFQVKKGLHEFLFRLLILGYLMDSEGNMWKNSNKHLYIIEILRPDGAAYRNDQRAVSKLKIDFIKSCKD